MRAKKYGNFSMGQIVKMKVDFLGRDLFCDTNFCEYEKTISWSNFIDKTYNGEVLNLENAQIFDKRLSAIVCNILKFVLMENNGDKTEIKKSAALFSAFIVVFLKNYQ